MGYLPSHAFTALMARAPSYIILKLAYGIKCTIRPNGRLKVMGHFQTLKLTERVSLSRLQKKKTPHQGKGSVFAIDHILYLQLSLQTKQPLFSLTKSFPEENG